MGVVSSAGVAGVPVAQEVKGLRQHRQRLVSAIASGREEVATITGEIERLESTAEPLRAAADVAERQMAAAAAQEAFIEAALDWLVRGTAPAPDLVEHLRTACELALAHPEQLDHVGHRYLAFHREQFLELILAACREQAQPRSAHEA